MLGNSGIDNERLLEQELNGKKYSDINQTHLKEFIKEMYPYITPSTTISCRRTEDNRYKQDLIFNIEGQQMNVSVKIGSGNSIHQESFENFLNYLSNDLKATEKVLNDIRFFHWGDGTLDGNGKTDDRMRASEIKRKYPNVINNIQYFFEKNKRELLFRFLSIGTNSSQINSKVDYIYYGDIHSGKWISLEEAINMNLENSIKPPSVGLMSYQTYGRSLKGKDDKRRKDIQVKWGNLDKYMNKVLTETEKAKQIGDNSHGFMNVKIIRDELDYTRFKDITNTQLKQFVKYLFPDIRKDSILHCERDTNNQKKGDLIIGMDDLEYRISVLFGASNSIHQEKIESFIEFMRKDLKADDRIIKLYLLYHWADGTENNTGEVKERLSLAEFKKLHPSIIPPIQEFFDDKSIRYKVLNRFFNSGQYNSENVDFIYYGSKEYGSWAPMKKVIDYITNEKKGRGAVSVGSVTIQTYGRSLHGKDDIRREYIQAKWGSSQRVIKTIMESDEKNLGNNLGDNSEADLVSKLNHKSNVSLWNTLGIQDDLSNYYAVKVDSKVPSTLADGSKVYPKSDVYITKAEEQLSNDELIAKNYILRESDLNGYNTKPIYGTGVSVKRDTSRSFTFAKLSFKSFNKLVENSSEIFVGILLFVNKKDIDENYKIMNNFNFSLEKLAYQLGVTLSNEDNELDTFKRIKNVAREKFEYLIINNKKVYNKIFFGTSIFKEPYNASYLYIDKMVNINNLESIPFTITTGSGRHKGIYTIVIKPK